MDRAFTSVISPFALTEAVVGRSIPWDRMKNAREVVEGVLQTPFDRLLDASDGSVLYLTQQDHDGEDHVAGPTPTTNASFSKILAAADIPGSAVPDVMTGFGKFTPDRVRQTIATLYGGAVGSSEEAWAPENTDWKDTGDFFDEAAEGGDPVQGALGDCYFIAALASVAWSRPYVLAQRTRQVGESQEDFVDIVRFHARGDVMHLEVSEKTPVEAGTNHPLYARSSEDGENWVGIYEKAYAKWKTENRTDRPEYPEISGGDPVQACTELLGGEGRTDYIGTEGATGDELYTYVRNHSRGGRTFNPMVAWTYSTSAEAPADIDYDTSSGFVANHAYSVLGWDWVDGEKYLVCRNPWGRFVPRGASRNWTTLRDQRDWTETWEDTRSEYSDPLALNTNGVFAIRVDEAKKYFKGLGFAE